jgi:hypothetical protein
MKNYEKLGAIIAVLLFAGTIQYPYRRHTLLRKIIYCSYNIES